MEKTHWKKAFKSDYLSASDVDNGDLILTIKYVRYQECVTASGKKMCNVAHFTDNKVKPMILNVTNSKIIKGFANNATHLEDWTNIPVAVYVDSNVRFGSEITEGLRIRKQQPRKQQLLSMNDVQFKNAVESIKNGKTIDEIKAFAKSKNVLIDKDTEFKLIAASGIS